MDRLQLLNAPGLRGSAAQRFWRAVELGPGCWQWKNAQTSRGYGRIATPWSTSTPAHHVAVILDGREIPEGRVVDHICRNRLCVNPAHLRVVSVAQNALENSEGFSAKNAAKTHCQNGHTLSGDNVRIKSRGHRECKTCHREYKREWLKQRRILQLEQS